MKRYIMLYTRVVVNRHRSYKTGFAPIAKKKMFGVEIHRYCLFRGEKPPQVYDKAGRYLVWDLLKPLLAIMLSWIDFEIWKKERK